MSNHPKPPTRAPFDLGSDRVRWVYDVVGRQFPIVAVSRRTITIAVGDARLDLKRRRLERAGSDSVNGLEFRVTRYELPGEAA